MSKYEHATTGFLGFASGQDFVESFVGLKTWTTNAVIAFFGAVTTFVSGFMWDDPKAVYTLWVLMSADWATGILKGIINKKFTSYKLWRMPLYFVATSFVLAISWWVAKYSILFAPLPGIVIGGFFSVYFASILENLGELGLLPKPIVKLLKSKFGLKKLFDKETKTE